MSFFYSLNRDMTSDILNNFSDKSYIAKFDGLIGFSVAARKLIFV
jgi:hypothetical protein